MTVESDPEPAVYVRVLSLVTMVTFPGASVTPVPRGPVMLGDRLPDLLLLGKGGGLDPVPRGIYLEGAWLAPVPVL